MKQENLRTGTLFLIGLCVIVLAGCAASANAPTRTGAGAPAAKRTGTVRSIGGVWKSHVFGIMKLKQSGGRVRGTYDCNDGQLEGTVEGNRFTYRWWENVPNRPYEKAFKTHRGDGYFDILKDGKLLDGKWRIEDVAEWGGDWRFRRIR